MALASRNSVTDRGNKQASESSFVRSQGNRIHPRDLPVRTREPRQDAGDGAAFQSESPAISLKATRAKQKIASSQRTHAPSPRDFSIRPEMTDGRP